MSRGVSDIDMGWGKIKKEAHRLATMAVEIGVQSGETAPDGADMADIAAVQEFGSEKNNIPARPFMRESFDKNVDDLDRFMQDAGNRIMQGQITVDKGLDLVGQKMTGIIQKGISDGPWTPNAPGTVAQKGSSQPLIDTGRLRQSIRHVVKSK